MQTPMNLKYPELWNAPDFHWITDFETPPGYPAVVTLARGNSDEPMAQIMYLSPVEINEMNRETNAQASAGYFANVLGTKMKLEADNIREAQLQVQELLADLVNAYRQTNLTLAMHKGQIRADLEVEDPDLGAEKD